MSRNTEYQFIPTDTETMVSMLVAAYEKITGTTVQPASPERLFIQWVCNIIVQERVLNNWTGNQNIPSRAEGANLDALAELFYTKNRPKAKAATCTMRFSISKLQETAVLIPSGTRITDASGALVWATEADAYVPIGETTIETPIRCQTVGLVGNGYAPGQINKLVDLFDYYLECENTTESGGGSNGATDDEFYELLRASMDAYSSAGARGAYEYWAKQTSTEIADVLAVSPTPCVVKLYVLMKDGTLASEAVKAAVLAECNADEHRPLADKVSVEDAEKVPYNVDLTYYLHRPLGNGKTGADLAAAVQAAVDQYTAWQSGKLGRDINPSYLTGLLMQTGIKRVELPAPEFVALQDGSGGSVPQIASLGGVRIVNGGYEDE